MATPALACKAALAEATVRWPMRNRASDGIIGDASHQARKSDHNLGNAYDLTNDPVHGVDCNVLAEIVKQDPRVSYVIWNRRISNPAVAGGAWRSYGGENPHTKHMHVSIKVSARGDTSPWFGRVHAASAGPAARPPLPEPSITAYEGDAVKRIDVQIDTDAEGRGYRDITASPREIVSVLSNTANPPDQGYKPIPDVARLDVGGRTRIVVEEAVPNGRIDVAVWVAA